MHIITKTENILLSIAVDRPLAPYSQLKQNKQFQVSVKNNNTCFISVLTLTTCFGQPTIITSSLRNLVV
jgi:hypothetical protein